ncbi:MAG: hypothetical protein ACJ76M_00740 [Solirubrobacteraceae bacterium]
MADSPIAIAAPYVERLAVNEYVQDRLFEAAQQLQAAYARGSRRSARKAAQDRKVQARVKRGLEALGDATVALRTGRKRKRRSVRPLVVGGVAVGAAGTVAAGVLLREKRASGDAPERLESSPEADTTAPEATPSAA